MFTERMMLAGALALVSTALHIVESDAMADNLLTETFDCPPRCQPDCLPACVASSKILPLGGVSIRDIQIVNGFLAVPFAAVGDGIKIEFPDLPPGRCFKFETFIDPAEFDHSESYLMGLDVEVGLGSEEGVTEFRAMQLQFLRDPSWNRCQIMVEYTNQDGKAVKSSIFFGCGQDMFKTSCPGRKQVSFDWVEGDKAQVEVRDERGNIIYLGNPKKLPFTHKEGRVVGMTIKKVRPITLADGSPVPCQTIPGGFSDGFELPDSVVPETDEGGRGRGSSASGGFVGGEGFTFMIDTIEIDSEHIVDGALPPITLRPDAAGQGETLDVWVETRDPMFTGKPIFNFGPNITINTVAILGPQSAVLNVTIDPNSVAYRRVLIIDTGAAMEDFGFAAPFEILDVNPCTWDLDGDDNVGVKDLLFLLGVWGPCPRGDCPADFDDSGDIGVKDLLILLGNWGPCPEVPNETNCCSAHDTPGCHDPDCVALVCEIDLLCCEVEWDQMCAGLAADLCKVCQ